ncbi:hypothetical protein TWF730_005076 [Orbilia blumenaviensis]|uniref:Secreted protein n=1 Tax=Orbilia blumenaviensis TaxID=1796055 RepID=A0AAV9VH77_9PEZI
MAILKLVAVLSASTLVVAPVPGWSSKYRIQNQNQNQGQNQPLQDSSSSIGTNSFGVPMIIPATPGTENPNPLGGNIPINSEYSMSQYSPSDNSRDMNLDLAAMQFPSAGGQTSGYLLSPINGTPRSARRQIPRFPSPEQRRAGVSTGTRKTRNIEWEDDGNVILDDALDERVGIPTTIQMLGIPSTSRERALPRRDQLVMEPTWRSRSPDPDQDEPGLVNQGEPDIDGEGTESSSDDDDLGLNELPPTDQLISYRPGVTRRVQRAMVSRDNAYRI